MTAQKTKKKVFTKAKDIAQFTLPTPEENTVPQAKNNKIFFSPNAVPDSSRESIFWHTRKGKIWMSAFGVSIVMALIVGLFMYREGATRFNINNQKTPTPSSAPAEKPQVYPTPTPKAVDVSKYKIEILNGSGIPGEAAKLKKQIETEKFTVSSIGNGDRLDYQKTIIQVKKTVTKEFLEKLKSFLEKKYILDDIKELGESEKSDVIIIVGSNKVSEYTD